MTTNLTINVAVVDDSQAIATLTKSTLLRECKKRYPHIKLNIQGYLKSYDFEVGAVENKFDLVLMDYHLDVFNGVEVMQRIESNYPKVQCIYVVSEPKDVPENVFQLKSTVGVVKKQELMFNNIISAIHAIWALKRVKKKKVRYRRVSVILSMILSVLILFILYTYSS